MAQADWVALANQAAAESVANQATMAQSLVPPDGVFSYAFMSHVADVAFSGRVLSMTNFAPMADVHSHRAGCSISGYLRKHTPTTGVAKFAPMLFALDSNDTPPDLANNPQAYKLGLSEGSPYYITLAKGSLATGGLKTTAGNYLLHSTASYADARWIGLKLDVLFNPQGEIVLNVYHDANSDPTNPDWQRPPGFGEPFIDDGIGLLSPPGPLIGYKWAGFGQWSEQSLCCSAFDYIQVGRQINP